MVFVRSFRDVRANILIEKKRKRIEKNERGSAARSFSNLREHETNLGRRPRVAGGVGEGGGGEGVGGRRETQLRESCARCALPLAFYGAVSLMKRG